jgi:transcription elongation factor GreA
MNKVPVTVKGHKLLQEELQRLKTVARPEVIKAIAEARAHGDLKENAEYHAAKEQQGFIEARIKDIEGKLSHLQVIDVTAVDARGKVIFGSTVELFDESSGKEIIYKIVGEDEADIGAGLISYTSPIARALIGQNEGDVISSRSSRSLTSDLAVLASGAAGFFSFPGSRDTAAPHYRFAEPAPRCRHCKVSQ